MKKIITAGLLALLSLAAMPASACPAGTHPYGGVGPHHAGGWCGP